MDTTRKSRKQIDANTDGTILQTSRCGNRACELNTCRHHHQQQHHHDDNAAAADNASANANANANAMIICYPKQVTRIRMSPPPCRSLRTHEKSDSVQPRAQRGTVEQPASPAMAAWWVLVVLSARACVGVVVRLGMVVFCGRVRRTNTKASTVDGVLLIQACDLVWFRGIWRVGSALQD